MKLAIKIIVFTFHPSVYISYLCEFHHQFVKSFGASHNLKFLIIIYEQNICKCRVTYFTLAYFPGPYTSTLWSGWVSKMWHGYKDNTLVERLLLSNWRSLMSQAIEIQKKTPLCNCLIVDRWSIKTFLPRCFKMVSQTGSVSHRYWIERMH